jgi:hypothetical protein
VCRTNALESLVIASFVRGLSVRDVEAALAEALGSEAALSKSTVSRICEAIKVEFDAWRTRDLSDVHLDYLFLDGSHFKFHPGSAAEPVLCAWGLAPGASESHDAWADFLDDLVGRGLIPPLLVVSDGAPGLIGACEVVLAKSLRQRCLIHRARNVLAKVPKVAQAEVKAEFWKIFDDIDAPAGQEAVDVVRRRIASFEKCYATTYPAAVKCLTTDIARLTVYLRSPRSTGSASATPTSSSAPSARPAGASRSSAAFRANAAASPSCGPCSTGRRRVGAASNTLRRRHGCSTICGDSSSNHRARSHRSLPPRARRKPSQLSRNLIEQEPASVSFYTVSGTPPLTALQRRNAGPKARKSSAATLRQTNQHETDADLTRPNTPSDQRLSPP